MDTTNDNDYFELEPYEQYKPQDSKFSASLKWLLSKADLNASYLNEPYFEENELGKSLRSEIVHELINGKIYCTACQNLFQIDFEAISDILDHLARNSILVNDENDDPVTWEVIAQSSPFYVSAHLALIDSIMMYYSLRIMRFETVVNSLKKYSRLHPYNDLPTNLEQVCAFWLNQVTRIFLNCIENECDTYAKQSSLVRCQSHIYLNEIGNDISLSLSNGTIIAILIVFYTCDLEIDLNDICLQENVGFEESVENLNLIKEFCDKCISPRMFCFNFEDFLYSPLEMSINKLAFIADLFYLFELSPQPNLAVDNHFEKLKDYLKRFTKKHYHVTTPFLSARIGDVTRNSFIKKGSYAPGQSVNNDNSKKLNLSTATSNSMSLLDNVSLEASNNFDITTTPSVNLGSKFRLNDNGDYAEIEHDDDEQDDLENVPNESNGGFSSRTYIKSSSSSTNRMNSNENTKTQNEFEATNESGMKTVRINSTSCTQNLPVITDQKTESLEIPSSTGLVRRLSVTARPGDIFYKVKDVTESSSTTDNCDQTEVEHTDNVEQEIIIKPQKQDQINTNTWRKTTTWNVKRNQSSQNETETGRETPKNDSGNSSMVNIEPGSPMFTKELLSIRMQLKEKKTSMERDKRKLETELEKQRQNIGKQVFLQVVQKKSQTEEQRQQTEPQKQTESLNNSTCESPSPSQLTNSPNNLNSTREATRRQWDKTQKNFINDLDQNSKEEFVPNNTGTSSVSSLSTPTSSASQSPPLNTNDKQQSPVDPMAVDLSKAYYSRDEVIKAIESLKDKYINTSSLNKIGQNSNGLNTPSMVKDIEVLNNKLNELQSEINRLTLTQQNQPKKPSFRDKTPVDDVIEHKNNDSEQTEVNENPSEGSFFISFGSGAAKREKPTLTPKKNLIFIKTNDEKPEVKTPTNPKNNNLLMTAIKQANETPNKPLSDGELVNIGHEGDIDDGDSNEIKQRKRELIIQKQLERRQQQEIRRLQLEEERAIKAEELRQKEEELAMKKLVEKNRKETIFQAYIDKKKQSEVESMAGCFGPPNSLINAKKFHSTNRLKQPSKSNTQNLLDHIDQASLYSDRSANGAYASNTMVKTSNKTGVNQSYNLIEKQSPTTNTYVRKRPNIPTSATFCSVKTQQTPDSATMTKRVSSHATSPMNGYQNQFLTQSPSMNNFTNEAEYSGPKLYKRLTGKTNKSTVINSLNQLVLAGTVNAQLRKQVIEEIEASDARHFVILFRDYHLQYRGVYSYTSETDYIEKVIGQGPARISEDMIEKYYKYNSGGKQFSPVQTKHLSIQCDAVTIHGAYWQSRKASNPVTNVNQMGVNVGNFNFQSPLASNQNTLRR